MKYLFTVGSFLIQIGREIILELNGNLSEKSFDFSIERQQVLKLVRNIRRILTDDM